MSNRNRIPAAIEPLLRLPPEASLTILTGTLACNPSWLTLRFIGAALAQDPIAGANESNEASARVVLVSWMRDLAFWKNEIRRGMVCDRTSSNLCALVV